MATELGVTDGASIRQAFAPHLPHLRRYARALTGSQARGDAGVLQTLEAMLAAPDTVDIGASSAGPRVALFRRFTHVAIAAEPGLMANIGMQALLLIAVEGFSPAQAAMILGVAEADIITEMQAAQTAIAATLRSRVLIIEDEPLIAMHLEQIVTDMGHNVVAMAMTHSVALAQALAVAPELVLADIQLADGSSGLAATRAILEHFDVPVVFITAYPERLLTGERPEPTFLVTKPFKVETVIATIGQALLARRFKLADAI